MTEDDLKLFKTLIQNRLSELAEENALGHSSQAIVQLDQQSVGRLSRMDALQNQAMAQAQQVRRDAETKNLKSAMERVSDQTYGFCEDCGEDIPLKRLELNLATTRCVHCASG